MGIRLGDFELHPGVGSELGYDTNYYQGSGQENPPFGQGSGSGSGEPEIAALRLQITPAISLSSLGPQRTENSGVEAAPPKVEFRSTASLRYTELFFPDADRYAGHILDQRTFQGDIGLKLNFLPRRPWGGDLALAYTRIAEPSNDYSLVSAFDRNLVSAAAGLVWRPGGGLMDWRLGYRIGGAFFERSGYDQLDNSDHGFSLDGNWRFLPRTALVYRGEVSVRTYGTTAPETPGGAAVGSQLGIRGLLTRHFGALALGGWKSTFYNVVAPLSAAQTSNYDGPTARIEVSWYPQPAPEIPSDGAAVGLSSVSVGYHRDAPHSYIGNFYQQDRFYLNGEYFLGGFLLLNAEAGFARVARPPAFFNSGARRNYYSGLSNDILAGELIETRLDVLGFAEYRIIESLGINLTLRYNGGLKDAVVDVIEAPAPTDIRSRDNLRFSRFEAYLGVRWLL